MPLSSSEPILSTSTALLSTLRTAQPPNTTSFRPLHAKGRLLTGTFTPTPLASVLSKAPHFSNATTPISVRFSSTTGLPSIPDTDPTSNPRGFALRFHLPTRADGRRAHTDIIANSTPFFPVRTGDDFLALLQAIGAGGDAVSTFVDAHPATKRWLDAPKPSPVSFGTLAYWGVNAFVLVGEDGTRTTVRYRVEPVAGVQTLEGEEVEKRSENYLFEEVVERVERGPIVFRLKAQVAGEGDVVDDATVVWPEEREVVDLGEVRIERTVGVEESLKEEKGIIFDPVPRVEGVEGSGDPLLEVRASLYLMSGRQRREAEVGKA